MKIIDKPLSELTPAEYRACLHLNMRGDGMMMYSLMEHKYSPHARAIMLWDDKLIGWALMVPVTDETQYWATRYGRRKARYVSQFYVRKPYRRRGYGGMLMDAVKERDRIPLVIPHDDQSGSFFAKYEVVADKHGRQRVIQAKKKKRRAA